MGEINGREIYEAIKDRRLIDSNPALREVYLDYEEKKYYTDIAEIEFISYGWFGWIFFNKKKRAARKTYLDRKVHSDAAWAEYQLVKKLTQEPDTNYTVRGGQ